jgi:hypothetical protein
MNPGTPPHILADLAARRWDLHALIAANPGSYPQLIHWMRSVNPTLSVQATQSVQPQPWPQPLPGWQAAPAFGPPAPRRRGGIGGWLAGCGCLAVAALMAVVVFAGLGALLNVDSDSNNNEQHTAAPPAAGSEIQAQIELYHQERAKIDELAVVFDGTPVGYLVAGFERLYRQDEAMADPNLGEYSAKTIVTQTTTFREQLEASIATAETRRTNASGSVAEGIVDAAGKGFIDIQWDAAAVCLPDEREDWTTTACVKKEDSLTIHLLPENELGEWASTRTVVHELAHVYQRADNARFLNNDGEYKALLEQGLFQGSMEVMADCFSLAYYNEWTLSQDDQNIGYGYVCGDSERQAIRAWAASINAPMG